MQDQRDFQQLHRVQQIEAGEIPNEDRIRPYGLAETCVGVVIDNKRLHHPADRLDEAVEHEPMLPQEQIDVGEQRLVLVHLHEFDFRLDQQAVCEFVGPVPKNLQLRTLNIDLQKIEIIDLGNIIEADCLDRLPADDLPPFVKAMKAAQHRRIGLQQGGHPRRFADSQGLLGSIINRMG